MSENKRIYIYTDTADNSVTMHGISCCDFLTWLQKTINNVLLISHKYEEGCYHAHSGFTYVSGDVMQPIAAAAGLLGNFCWVDFTDKAALDRLSPQEIAELLYFAHKGQPLGRPVSGTLGGNFAYWSHDDGWFARVCCADLTDFLPVLSTAVSSAADSPLPTDKAAQLLRLSEGGLLLDGGDVTATGDTTGLPFYVIGRITDMDDLINNLCVYKESAVKTGLLRFTRTGKNRTNHTERLQNVFQRLYQNQKQVWHQHRKAP